METITSPKPRSSYSSSILKFRVQHKIIKNAAVIDFTQDQVPVLESLAEEIKMSKSMTIENVGCGKLRIHRTQVQQNRALKKQIRQVRTAVLIQGACNPETNEIDPYIGGDSVDSLSSIMEEDEIYSSSIVLSSIIRDPEELIDKDLLDLLAFIKTLTLPREDTLTDKYVRFGEITRHKTLIFDLDETLIHA